MANITKVPKHGTKGWAAWEAILRHPGMSATDIANRVGAHNTIVSRLRVMAKDYGLVDIRKEGTTRVTSITEQGKAYVEGGLVLDLGETPYKKKPKKTAVKKPAVAKQPAAAKPAAVPTPQPTAVVETSSQPEDAVVARLRNANRETATLFQSLVDSEDDPERLRDVLHSMLDVVKDLTSGPAEVIAGG